MMDFLDAAPRRASSSPSGRSPGTREASFATVSDPPLVDAATALDVLALVADLQHVPFDRRRAAPLLAPVLDARRFHEVLQEFGLCARTRWLTSDRQFPDGAMPSIVFVPVTPEDGATAAGAGGGDVEPVVVLGADNERLLVRRPGSTGADVCARDALAATMMPWVVVLEAAEPVPRPETEDGFDSPTVAFGWRWFLPELVKHRSVWRDVLIASLVIQLVGLAVPLLTQVIVDKVVTHDATSTLIAVGGALAVFMAFSVTLTWARQWLVLQAGTRIDAALAREAFGRLLRLPLPWHERHPVGTVVTRLQGLETIREFLTGAMITLALDIPFVMLFLALMFWYSWLLSLSVVAGLAALVVGSVVVTPALRRRADRQFRLGGRTQAFVTEYTAGIATAKLLQAEAQLERGFDRRLRDYLDSAMGTRRLAIGYGAWTGAVEQSLSLAVLTLGAWQVMREPGFTVGMLVAFQMLAGRLSQPVMRLAGLWLEAQQAAVAVRRLGDLMNEATESYATTAGRPDSGEPGLRLERVSYRYADTQPWVLENVDLTVRRGEIVVLTGTSGSGKSTLARLLGGFAHAQRGRILVNGLDPRHLGVDELRSLVGVIPQETRLFAGTVLDNLALANPAATTADIVQACRAAGIHETLSALPNGYHTPIREGGVGLSGGQRQRIAIARALLKRPDVLVFDEATSGLDAAAAARIARTLNALKSRVAIVFIAHQWPRDLAVDRIHRLDAVPAMPAGGGSA